MKKLLALALSFAMVLSMAACGQQGTTTPEETTQPVETTAPETSAPATEEPEDNLLSELVTTAKGDVQGFATTGAGGGTLYCYYGVPYAEAPVGELRWKDAQEKSAWEGVLDCTTPLTEQNSNYQWGTNLLAYFETLNESEDCLYLNITTPAETTDEGLPVIVWFHGGGLFGGSGSEEIYNLTNLPERGCIIVSVTTRLGALGLLTADVLGSTEGTANAGNFIISDMIAALEWVQDNIAAFGGDPNNVTINGESGGGGKVMALMASDEAAGLFDSAIIQSGPIANVDYATALEQGNQLMEALGVTTLEEAQALSAEDIVAAYNELGLDFSLVTDGYYLEKNILEAIESGEYNQCDVIVGLNEGEIPNLGTIFGMHSTALAVLNRVAADGNNAYAYELDQVPATWREYGFHAVHSLDLAYLFGEYTDSNRFYSGGPWEQNFVFWGLGEKLDMAAYISPTMDEADIALSDYMMRMWVSFAENGEASIDEVEWTPWNAEAENYLYLSTVSVEKPEMRDGFGALADIPAE